MKRIDGVAYPTVTEDAILGFFREYRFLSNFHLCSVFIERTGYPSSEHAYMAMKTLQYKYRRVLAREIPDPKDAKNYGQTIPLRPGWESIKQDKMYAVLRCKFIQNKYLRILLDRTGDKRLEETNWWNDTYWGVCNGVGENNLGKLLMRVREELR